MRTERDEMEYKRNALKKKNARRKNIRPQFYTIDE